MHRNQLIYQINSLQCEQNVGWRKNVAMNLCPLTCKRWDKVDVMWLLIDCTSIELLNFLCNIFIYLMNTSSHSTTSTIEGGTLFKFGTATATTTAAATYGFSACNSTLCIALICWFGKIERKTIENSCQLFSTWISKFIFNTYRAILIRLWRGFSPLALSQPGIVNNISC